MMSQQSIRNSSSRKTQFAIRFVRALARIKMATPIVSSVQSRIKCSRRIKGAADTSMAATIGSRRSWGRAILLKHRNQVRHRVLIRQKVVGNNKGNKTRKIKVMNKEKKQINKERKIDNIKGVQGSVNRANKLRKLVPGGDAMDLCSLLEETAHYIKALNTQVQLMQKIADIYET
ncbi:hypothetical protein MKX03_012815 [Papaver bracteatum]|nr:hypothetical protein MKX03_012815 [Papaver bracteatum]